MDQPNKDKKKTQANGQPIGSTQRPISRTPEQEILDAKASKLAKTQKGKEHMAKAGQDVDIKTGKATAKPFEGKYIPGDKTIGRRGKYVKGGKVVHQDTYKDDGTAEAKYKRDKKHTEDSRKQTQDVHRTQVSGEENKAYEERRRQNEAMHQNRIDGLQKTTPTKKVFKKKK